VVAVVADVANERSTRAVERYVSDLGGREEGTVRNGVANADGSVVDVRRWSVTREEWREATGGAVPELSFE
jgi:RimJ/RimL family protein N-acetyltransferase